MGMTSTGGAKKDIFSDLKGVKRANPFVNKAGGANGSMKQKKICWASTVNFISYNIEMIVSFVSK